MQIPPPPDGFRVATSTHEVFQAASRARRSTDRLPLRVYVDRQWIPGSVNTAIDAVPRRPATRNVAMAWGEPPLGDGRRLPFDRIAVPFAAVETTTRIPLDRKAGSHLVEVITTMDVTVSAIHLRDGSTGVSLLVPLGQVTTVHVGDQGRVLATTNQTDVPPVAVGLTPAAARQLARSLVAKADEIDPDGKETTP